MRRLSGLLFLLATVGCADIVGLNQYMDGVDSGDAFTGFDSASDSSDSASDSTDSRTDAPSDGCVPTGVESCGDGLDNDCNGKIDCADPACTSGYVCAPGLPNGWQRSAYDQDQRPACPMGYASQSDVDEGINASPATCGCGCTTSAPSCTTGNLTITAGLSGMNGCQNVANQMESAAGGCQTLSANINSGGNQKMSATGPAPTGGSCAAQPSKSVPAVTFQHQGRTCAFTPLGGGGCNGSQACVPSPAPYKQCVQQAGMTQCPSDYPVQHFAGSTVVDTRDCVGACTCTFNAGTCGGTITMTDDGSCMNNAFTMPVDGACRVATAHTWKTYKYAPQTSQSCTHTSPAPTGMAVFTDLQTICCTN